MVSAGVVKYRITTGPQGFGPNVEGKFSRETVEAVKGLLKKAKYKNWKDKQPHFVPGS